MIHFHNPVPVPLPVAAAAPAAEHVIVIDDSSDDDSVVIVGNAAVAPADASDNNNDDDDVVIVVPPPLAEPIAEFRARQQITVWDLKPQPKKPCVFRPGGAIFSPSKPAMNDFALRCVRVCSPRADRRAFHEVTMDISFYFKIPETRRNQLHTGVPHTQRPDIDNLQKFVLDAMQGVYFNDDAVVHAGLMRKVWGNVHCTVITMTFN